MYNLVTQPWLYDYGIRMIRCIAEYADLNNIVHILEVISEVEADISLFLECMRVQAGNTDAVVQALVSVSQACANTDDVQKILRKTGGVKYIHEVWLSGAHIAVCTAAMYCLACATENNAENQKLLSTTLTFAHLHRLLCESNTDSKATHAAVFFLLTLVAGNNLGQTLLRNSKCLEKLIDLFHETRPKNAEPQGNLSGNHASAGKTALWCSTTCLLSAAVNNPQNDENQRICASIFPQALKILEEQSEVEIVRPLTVFLGLCAAKNVHNQLRMDRCNGLEVLVSCLHHAVNRCHDNSQQGELAVCFTGTLDKIVTDNERNAEKVGALGAIPLFVELLSLNSGDDLLKVVLALANTTELCVKNEMLLVQCGGLGALIKLLGQTGDRQVSTAVRYVLQKCVNIDTKTLKNQPLKLLDEFNNGISILNGVLGDNSRKTGTISNPYNTTSYSIINALNSPMDRILPCVQSAPVLNTSQNSAYQITAKHVGNSTNYIHPGSHSNPLGEFGIRSIKSITPGSNSIKAEEFGSSRMEYSRTADCLGMPWVDSRRLSSAAAGAGGDNRSKYSGGLNITREGDVESVCSSHMRGEEKLHDATLEKELMKKVLELERRLDDRQQSRTVPFLSTPMATPMRKADKFKKVESEADKENEADTENVKKNNQMTSSKYFEEPRTSTPYNDLAEIKNFGVEKSPIRPITSPVTQPGEQEEICAQLVAELQKERSVRRRLERGAGVARQALAEHRRGETAAGQRTQQLAEELERQQREQEKTDTQLQKQVEESVREHDRLYTLKQDCEQELNTIEQQLQELQDFAEESGIELRSPAVTQNRIKTKLTLSYISDRELNTSSASARSGLRSCLQSPVTTAQIKHLDNPVTIVRQIKQPSNLSVCDDKKQAIPSNHSFDEPSNQHITVTNSNHSLKDTEQHNPLSDQSLKEINRDTVASNRSLREGNRGISNSYRSKPKNAFSNYSFNEDDQRKASSYHSYIDDSKSDSSDSNRSHKRGNVRCTPKRTCLIDVAPILNDDVLINVFGDSFQRKNRKAYSAKSTSKLTTYINDKVSANNRNDRKLRSSSKSSVDGEYLDIKDIQNDNQQCERSIKSDYETDSSGIFLKPRTPVKIAPRRQNLAKIEPNPRMAASESTSSESEDTSVIKVTPRKPLHRARRRVLSTSSEDNQNGDADLNCTPSKRKCRNELGRAHILHSNPSSPAPSIQSEFDSMLVRTAEQSSIVDRQLLVEKLLSSSLTIVTPHKLSIRPPNMSRTPLSVKKRNSGIGNYPSVVPKSCSNNGGSVAGDNSNVDGGGDLNRIRRHLGNYNTDFRRSTDNGDQEKGLGDGQNQSHDKTQGNNSGLNRKPGVYDKIDSGTDTDSEVNEDASQVSHESDDLLDSVSTKSARSKNKCPGCQPPRAVGCPLLNSHNFNLAIETNPYTCPKHRMIRKQERQFIHSVKRQQQEANKGQDQRKRLLDQNASLLRDKHRPVTDVYEFASTVALSSHSTEIDTAVAQEKVSPPSLPVTPLDSSLMTRSTQLSVSSPSKIQRRVRVPYSKQEEFNVNHGVKNLGKFWNQILNTYDFHESRTALDIMEKYKRMNKTSPAKTPPMPPPGPEVPLQTSPVKSQKPPFSMAEERRLRKGVKQYGHNWTVILHSYNFAKHRTASELREKWRTLHKHEVHKNGLNQSTGTE